MLEYFLVTVYEGSCFKTLTYRYIIYMHGTFCAIQPIPTKIKLESPVFLGDCATPFFRKIDFLQKTDYWTIFNQIDQNIKYRLNMKNHNFHLFFFYYHVSG